MKSEKLWVVLLACLLLGLMPGCDGDDDDDTTGDDDDTTGDDDTSAPGDDDTSAPGDDDTSAAPEFTTVMNLSLVAVNYPGDSTSWQAGTQIQIEIQIENAGPLDAWNYPELRISTAAIAGDLNSPERLETFFGVPMGDPTNWSTTFEADENASPQTVQFTATITPMDESCGENESSPCYESEPLTFSVDIE